MKKKLLDALKTKFVGIDEAVLDRIATKKAENVTDESQITAIVDGITIQDVVKSYGDYRANEAASTSVSNYEEKHGLKDGKPVNAGGSEEGKGKGSIKTYTADELDDYFSSKMEERWKPFQQKIDAYEAERTKSERQTKIASAMKDLGLSEDEMQFVTVPEDKDPKEYLTGYKQHLINKGLKPKTAEGAQVSDDQANKTVADGWLSAIASEEK